ncbi:unnamed protein product, partial [Staurois parvus]
MISVAPSVPPVSAHQCTSMPHISAHQSCLSVLLSVPVSAAYLCCLTVPISASYQCQSVPPIS